MEKVHAKIKFILRKMPPIKTSASAYLLELNFREIFFLEIPEIDL